MSELRKDPITGRWVIIAAERKRRPLDFLPGKEDTVPPSGPCPFCQGNEDKTPPEIFALRDKGTKPNTPGWQVRVVPNKFPALRIEGELNPTRIGLFDMMNGVGAHEVVIENSAHDRGPSDYSQEEMGKVIQAYRERMLDLRKDDRVQYILIFKNHGRRAGASLGHSHTQLIALPEVPIQVKEELSAARRHLNNRKICLFCDILKQELDSSERVVLENENFVCLEPFAPRFPFETWIFPKEHRPHFFRISRQEEKSLSEILPQTLRRIKVALGDPPYNYIIHTSPLKEESGYYHWHLEIMPQLTKIAGFELGTGFFMNPISPEQAAQQLKEVG